MVRLEFIYLLNEGTKLSAYAIVCVYVKIQSYTVGIQNETPDPVTVQVGLSTAQPQWRCQDWTRWLTSTIYQQALAPFTLRSCHSVFTRYWILYSTHHLSPLPVVESCVCKLVASLATQGVSYAILKAHFSALR